MFQLNHAPQSQESDEQRFARDVEVFVEGASVPPPGSEVESLIERAWKLSLSRHREGWLQWGSSGMPMTGGQIADHAEAAANALRAVNSSRSARRGIRDALLYTEQDDTSNRFSCDTRMVVGDILGLLICALTGAPHAYYETWDRHPTRTVGEVLTLLAAAAAFARRYGSPTTATA